MDFYFLDGENIFPQAPYAPQPDTTTMSLDQHSLAASTSRCFPILTQIEIDLLNDSFFGSANGYPPGIATSNYQGQYHPSRAPALPSLQCNDDNGLATAYIPSALSRSSQVANIAAAPGMLASVHQPSLPGTLSDAKPFVGDTISCGPWPTTSQGQGYDHVPTTSTQKPYIDPADTSSLPHFGHNSAQHGFNPYSTTTLARQTQYNPYHSSNESSRKRKASVISDDQIFPAPYNYEHQHHAGFDFANNISQAPGTRPLVHSPIHRVTGGYAHHRKQSVAGMFHGEHVLPSVTLNDVSKNIVPMDTQKKCAAAPTSNADSSADDDDDFELAFDSAEEAQSTAFPLQLINPKGDDVDEVRANNKAWVRKLMRAIMYSTYKDTVGVTKLRKPEEVGDRVIAPDLTPKNSKKVATYLDAGEAAEWARWQLRHTDPVTKALNFPTFRRRVEALAWQIFAEVVTVHESGFRLSSINGDKKSKCSTRLEKAITVLQDYAIVRYDVLVEQHLDEFAADPEKFKGRKLNNLWVNYQKAQKAQEKRKKAKKNRVQSAIGVEEDEENQQDDGNETAGQDAKSKTNEKTKYSILRRYFSQKEIKDIEEAEETKAAAAIAENNGVAANGGEEIDMVGGANVEKIGNGDDTAPYANSTANAGISTFLAASAITTPTTLPPLPVTLVVYTANNPTVTSEGPPSKRSRTTRSTRGNAYLG